MFKTNEQEVLKAEELERKKQEKELQKEYQAHLQQDEKIQEDYKASETSFIEEENKEEHFEEKVSNAHQKIERIEEAKEEKYVSPSKNIVKDIQSEQLEKEKQEFEKERESEIEKIMQDDEMKAILEEEADEFLEEKDQADIDNNFEDEQIKQGKRKEIEEIANLWNKAEKVEFDFQGSYNEFEKRQEDNFKPEVMVDENNNITEKEEKTNIDNVHVVTNNETNEEEENANENKKNENLLGSENFVEEKEEEINSTSVITKDNLSKEQKETVDPKLIEQAQLAEELKNSYEQDKQILNEQDKGKTINILEEEEMWKQKDKNKEGENKQEWEINKETTPNSEIVGLTKNGTKINLDNIVSEQLNDDIIKEWKNTTQAPTTIPTGLIGTIGTQTELPIEIEEIEEVQTTSVFDDAQTEGRQILNQKEKNNISQNKEDERLREWEMEKMQQRQNQPQQQEKEVYDPKISLDKNSEEKLTSTTITKEKTQVDTSIEVIQKMMANISYNVVTSALTISTVVAWLMLMVGVWMWIVDMFYGFSVQWYYSFIFYSLIIWVWVGVVRWSLSDHD